MKTFEYVITDEEGIHARPAGLFVKVAAKYKSTITISKEGKEADAKRIFAVMGLGAKKDEKITVTADGEDEEAAIMELETFLKENL